MCGNNTCWILILILLFGCGGFNTLSNNNGCGCGNNGCGCGNNDCGCGCS